MKSMTAYASKSLSIDTHQVELELRAVNGRFADFMIKLAREYTPLEKPIKDILAKTIARGRVTCFMKVSSLEDKEYEVTANVDLAKQYYQSIVQIKDQLQLEAPVQMQDILRLPGVMNTELQDQSEAGEGFVKAVLKAVGELVEDFDSMRKQEGEHLKQALADHLKRIAENLSTIQGQIGDVQKRYEQKIFKRLQELLEDSKIDESRVLTEAAMYADRSDVCEEIQRLKSHVQKMEQLLDSQGALGKKMDFVLQEMHREVNTLGVKIDDLSITDLVVEIKAELEKFREQIQNVE